MNLPNKLTIIRILLVPFLILFLLCEQIPYRFIFSILIFLIASFTDLFDGKIARDKNLVTNFGKFADPLADKILIISALICFIQLGTINCIPVIIIIFREFIVTSIRLVAAQNNNVIAANNFGKIKTVSQMISVVIIIILYQINNYFLFGNIALWISTIITIISGIIYIKDNRKFISLSE